MLVTPEANRRIRKQALAAAALVAVGLDFSFSVALAGTEPAYVLVATATQSAAYGGDGAAVPRGVGANSTRARGVLRGAG